MARKLWVLESLDCFAMWVDLMGWMRKVRFQDSKFSWHNLSSSTSHLEEPQNDPKPLNILTYAVVLLSVSNSPPDRVRPLNLFRSHYHFSYTHLVLSCLTLSYLPCNTLKRSRQHSKEKKKKSNFLFVYNKAFYLLAQVALLYIALLSSLPTAMTASFPHSSPFLFILFSSTILSPLSFLSFLFSLLSSLSLLPLLSLLLLSFHLFSLKSIILSFLNPSHSHLTRMGSLPSSDNPMRWASM